MRQWLRSFLAYLWRLLAPAPAPIDHSVENRFLREKLNDMIERNRLAADKRDAAERIGELIEARRMGGAGPWRVSQAALEETDKLVNLAHERLNSPRPGIPLREAPITAQGATGDIELALQNVEWRREINLSWLEFSRWGIQQIILISRLWYVKNPLIQRGINVTATYVFGRGVEVMSEDDDANEVIKEFFDRNKAVLGQTALIEAHKRLMYDGQIFWVFFADEVDKGKTTIRTIDATEVFEIITDPDDTDQPWYYRRMWTSRAFDQSTGNTTVRGEEAYYPALGYEPSNKPAKIKGKDVMWDIPVMMQKGGVGVAKWHFDTPKAYAALDWARNARRLLEADLTTRMALSEIALTITTKGGQQALEGAKAALGTTVGPTTNLWDQNPPPIAGATFASGPGTQLAAFDTRGAIRDPGDVKEYRNMVAMVFEVPPTWLGDMETSNLSTATTLDRPTELGMIAKQENWREALISITTKVLKVAQGAPSGRLSEKAKLPVREALRMRKDNGQWVYEATAKPDAEIQVKCIFPAIREGDIPANVKAIAEAMTLDNKGGQVVGIDEKVGVGLLFEQLGVEDSGDILEKMYPPVIKGKPGRPGYDPNRSVKPEAAPIPTAPPIAPGGAPQATPAQAANAPPVKAAERLLEAILRIAGKNGHSQHH